MRLRPTLPIALALTACSAFSDPAAPTTDSFDPGRTPGSGSGVAMPSPGFGFGGGVAGAGSSPFVGGIGGPVQVSDVPPPPIQGGTLLVARDGNTAVVSDPERDRVVVVDLVDQEILANLELRPGDDPGRLVEDAAGRVHVVLRRGGAIATLDLAARALVDRREVCAAPQGMAYAASSDMLLVACQEGKLVELPASGAIRGRTVNLDADLRDVIIAGERVLVSRFKDAELLALDADLRESQRSRPGEIAGPFNSGFVPPPPPTGDGLAPARKSFSANVAFRTVGDANGRVFMLHQRAQTTEIDISQADEVHPDGGSDGAAGNFAPEDTMGGGDPYGGGDMCSSILRPALSMGGADGVLASGPVLPAATLAVDAALSRDGRWLAIGVAGSRDVSRSTFGMFAQLSALVVSTDEMTTTPEAETGTCTLPGFDASGGSIAGGQVVAVAFDGQNRLVMQTREPATVQISAFFEGCLGCSPDIVIPLGGATRADTGHNLFHDDAGAGLACASCHPGGADDGHTWVFSGLGPRRTQLFNMGISQTLPLHWDGELATFNDLVAEVFVRRMGGADLTTTQVKAMGDWIESLEPGVPLRAAADEAAVRGQALFESDEVGCASCHSGALLTNNQSVDVGTGGVFQVPSLVGVAHHAPWIHDGCAKTLRERFDPACGGETHGKTGHLSSAQLTDLVAYLESL